MQQPKGIVIVKMYPDETRKSLRVKMTTAPSLDAARSMFKFVKVGRCYMIYGTMMVAAHIHQEIDCRLHTGVNAFPLLQYSHTQSFGAKQKKIALLDKVLDLLQPANVLLLLLDIDVFRDEHSEIGINTPLVEVVLEESLQVLVELGEGRAAVHLLG
jgi:hypothetical protein